MAKLGILCVAASTVNDPMLVVILAWNSVTAWLSSAQKTMNVAHMHANIGAYHLSR